MIEFFAVAWLWVLGVVLTVPFMLAVMFWGVWFDRHDGYRANWVSTIIISLIAWKLFNIPDYYMLGYCVAFFPTGILWSVHRYRVWCRKQVATFISDWDNYDTTQREGSTPRTPTRLAEEKEVRTTNLKRELLFTNNLDRIFPWVFSWPVGFVSRLVQDLVEEIIITYCQKLYNRVLEDVMKLIPPVDVVDVRNDSRDGSDQYNQKV